MGEEEQSNIINNVIFQTIPVGVFNAIVGQIHELNYTAVHKSAGERNLISTWLGSTQ